MSSKKQREGEKKLYDLGVERDSQMRKESKQQKANSKYQQFNLSKTKTFKTREGLKIL